MAKEKKSGAPAEAEAPPVIAPEPEAPPVAAPDAPQDAASQDAPPPEEILLDEAARKAVRAQEIEGLLVGMREQLADLHARRSVLQKEADRISNEMDALFHELEGMDVQPSTEENIRAYVDAQNRLRAQRFERQRQLLRLGADPDEIASPKMPIDAAMARGTGFGANRPEYPRK